MDPYNFEWSYHFIPIADMRMGLFGLGNVTRYMAGFPSPKAPERPKVDNWEEYGQVTQALARKLKVRGPSSIPKKFNFTNDPRVDPAEEFYKMTLRRAYESRASPSEIYDAARIAFLVGRIKYPVDITGYINKFFGQDCNSFVGNYLGISPYVSIRAYAHGYPGNRTIPDATDDIYTCRGLLPFPPVPDLDSIQTGTVLITYGSPDKTGNKWRHIALVQDFEPILSAGGARRSGMLSIVEWGRPGGNSDHYVPKTKVDIIRCNNPELPGKTFLAFKSPSKEYGPDAVRMFFDASRCNGFPNRGWHVCNPQGAYVYDG